jgi:hypothetical protein
MDNPEILITLGIQDAGNTQWQHWGHKTKKKKEPKTKHTHNTTQETTDRLYDISLVV